MTELEGRGVAWGEERRRRRGTSDEGRRRVKGEGEAGGAQEASGRRAMTGPGGTGHLPVLTTGLGLGGIEVAGAAGVWFRLADGRRVIDASNTAAPLGHCHPDLVAAVRGASGSPALNEGWVWPGRQQAA